MYAYKNEEGKYLAITKRQGWLLSEWRFHWTDDIDKAWTEEMPRSIMKEIRGNSPSLEGKVTPVAIRSWNGRLPKW